MSLSLSEPLGSSGAANPKGRTTPWEIISVVPDNGPKALAPSIPMPPTGSDSDRTSSPSQRGSVLSSGRGRGLGRERIQGGRFTTQSCGARHRRTWGPSRSIAEGRTHSADRLPRRHQYNTIRPHSSLGYVTAGPGKPGELARRWQALRDGNLRCSSGRST